MYPYGDTRTDVRPAYDDEGEEQAARWTVRFLAVATFVAVLAGTLFLSLSRLDEGSGSAAASRGPTATTAPPPVEVGPPPGVEIPGYVSARKAALAAASEERVAVVSLAKYSTQAQARAVAGSLPVVALLVAPAGVGPAVVTEDLAAWAQAQTEAHRSERDEIKRLIPTVDDPAFKAFYNEEVARLEKALRNFAPDSPMVFGVVVHGPAAALQALGARSEVRLVDVGETPTPDPTMVYRGLRPEETAKANEPPLRPL